MKLFVLCTLLTLGSTGLLPAAFAQEERASRASVCTPIGESCERHIECCDALCVGGTCGGNGPHEPRCHIEGQSCRYMSDCCSGFCVSDVCK